MIKNKALRLSLFTIVGGALGFGLSMLYTAFGST